MRVLLRALLMVVVLAAVAGLVFYFNPLWVADQQVRLQLWREGVKSEYVEAGGYRLHYFEAGLENGAPLLLIHGLGARGENWSKMLPAMARYGFHVYAPDLPGYGRSSHPKNANYSIAMEEAAMVSFAQAIHLPHVFVGGWSMGGWIAMKLAIDHPELVDRLVIYDSAGVYFPATFEAELFVPSDTKGLSRLMTALAAGTQPRPVPEFVSRAILQRLAENGWVVERSMQAMTDGKDLLDFRLHEIRQPTLVVWGAEDQLIPLAVGKRIHEEIPGSTLNVIEGCGHLAPLECWQPVVEATETFLRAQPPVRGGDRIFTAPAH